MKELFGFILIFLILVFVFFFTKNYSKLFLPSKKITTLCIQPSEEANVAGVSMSAFWFDPTMNEENKHTGKTILFCHGNFGNITQRNYMINFCKAIGTNLILYDYWGYGKSYGYPSTRKLIKNSDIVHKWVQEKVDSNNLVIWGESLGGSMAAYLSSKRQCRKLILCSTFSSLEDLTFGIQDVWFKKPIGFALNFIMSTLPTREWVQESNCPVLVVHSDEDELIPFAQAAHISTADTKRIQLLKIKGGHSAPKMDEQQIQKIISFIQDHEETEPSIVRVCMNVFDDIINQEW
jgi:pimeloyl-ACP methyl ester carboxylesterase